MYSKILVPLDGTKFAERAKCPVLLAKPEKVAIVHHVDEQEVF